MGKVGDKLKAGRGVWDFKNIDHTRFENHITKSVPGYLEGHNYITFLSDFFIRSRSRVYDIGCSTGNLIAKLSDYNCEKEKVEFLGIEPAAKFKVQFLKNTNLIKKNNHRLSFITKSIENIKLNECDMVTSYYTLQFVKPKFRQSIIDQIYSKLVWGGGFFFFEKVRGINARFHEMINLAYLEYKSKVGYTNDEIFTKMLSLKGTLEPYTTTENLNFLKRAGFNDITLIYKNLCFEGILAIK